MVATESLLLLGGPIGSQLSSPLEKLLSGDFRGGLGSLDESLGVANRIGGGTLHTLMVGKLRSVDSFRSLELGSSGYKTNRGVRVALLISAPLLNENLSDFVSIFESDVISYGATVSPKEDSDRMSSSQTCPNFSLRSPMVHFCGLK